MLTACAATSLALNRFGLMEFGRHPVPLPRASGGLMMIAGAMLVVRH